MTQARRRWVAVLGAAAMIGGGLTSGWMASAASASPAGPTAAGQPATPPTEPVCARTSDPRQVRCLALRRTDVQPATGVHPMVTPAGYGPADLRAAYALPSDSAGAGQTVAIVDAFDDPTAEADLAVYREQFGLPPCTTDNGCFRKVDQRGGTSYPTADSGWSSEIALDVQMVSAACPNCHILLVEADGADFDDLGASVNEAVALGAKFVSNSYGAYEDDSALIQYEPDYTHPGVVVTASTGDSGYGVGYPAASPGVTAVGGTALRRDGSTRGWSETVWSGAGSGCSRMWDKPSWQVDTGCTHRALADVSAVADPNTGVAVYDTFQSTGWQVFGGTSVSSPLIASIYALAGTPAAGSNPASYPYDALLVGAGGLNDVTAGINGSCDPAYLCTGEAGYDGPTGLGTPNGVSAFATRDHGTVTGTITDAATGQPVAGATVTVRTRTTDTDGQGHYTMPLPVGDYQVTVDAYGYAPQTLTVSLTTAGLTQDVALTALPRVAVTGTVTDASGLGVPLPATVTATDGAGTTTASTDPTTGTYRIDLLENTDYTLHVAAVPTGYQPVDRKVSVGTGPLTEDVGLVVAPSCTAPGYHATEQGTVESFDRTRAPHGWTVDNTDHRLPGYNDTPGWVFDNPGGRANDTGGTGNFAIVDSDHDGAMHVQDTTLTSPTTDLSDATTPALVFANDLHAAVNSTATVEVSTDGGAHWTTVWHRASYDGATGPNQQVVQLPRAAGQQRVMVRFHYTGSWSRWWAIDDVFLGNRTCTPTQGG